MAYQKLTLQKCQTVALTLKFNMHICDNSIEEKFTNQINMLFEMRKHVQNIEDNKQNSARNTICQVIKDNKALRQHLQFGVI